MLRRKLSRTDHVGSGKEIRKSKNTAEETANRQQYWQIATLIGVPIPHIYGFRVEHSSARRLRVSFFRTKTIAATVFIIDIIDIIVEKKINKSV